MPATPLTGHQIKNTYHKVLQTENGGIYNGLGDSVILDYSGSFSGDGSGLTNLPPMIITSSIHLPQSSYISTDVGGENPEYNPATLFWDDNAKTYAIYSDHSGVSLQIGQENWIRVYADEDIPNGSPVFVHSSLNNIPCVQLALADGIYNSTRSQVIGLATETILSGSIGVITSQGQVHEVDTSTFQIGDHLFLSNENSGSIVTTEPLDPYENVQLGYVLTSDPTDGIIQVSISNLGQRIYPFVGLTSTPTINISGSIATIGSASVNLCTSADGKGYIRSFIVPTTNITIPVPAFLTAQYITVYYNDGSPEYRIIDDLSDTDNIQSTPVYTIHFTSTGSISYLSWDSPGVLLANKLESRIIDIYGAQRATGGELNFSGSNITITSGTAYLGVNKITFPAAITTNVNQFNLVSHTGSLWTATPITGIVNTLYDSGTGLLPLGGNKYVVNYVWRGIGSANRAQVLLSTQFNQYADAVESLMPTPPTDLPQISFFCGRMICKAGTSTPILVESAFSTILSVAGITNHNNLLGLQGGDSVTSEFYHLSSTQYTAIISGSVIAGYTSKSSNYTLTDNDYTVECTSNTFDINLPTAVGRTGRIYNIKNTGTGTITVKPFDAQTIDGELTQTVSRPNNLQVQSNGSNWIVL